MPARRLLMRKIREVLRLRHRAGAVPPGASALARASAVGVGTVNRYLRRAAEGGLDWPLPAELGDAALDAPSSPRAAPVYERVRPDCAYIHRELSASASRCNSSGKSTPRSIRRLPLHAVLRGLPPVGNGGCGRRCDRSTGPARRRSSTSPGSGRRWSAPARASCGASSCSSPCSARAAPRAALRRGTICAAIPPGTSPLLRFVEKRGSVDPDRVLAVTRAGR